MATLTFQFTYDNTVRPNVPNCVSMYVNPPITSIVSSNNLIRVVGMDSTQFTAALDHIYTIDLYTDKPIARTYSFEDLKARNIIPQDTIYRDGPRLACANDLMWILYSVNQKLPLDILILTDLPPNANITGQATVLLESRVQGIGPNAYLEYYFPTSLMPERYRISFQTTVNNNRLATRFNASRIIWDVDNNDTYSVDGAISPVNGMVLQVATTNT